MEPILHAGYAGPKPMDNPPIDEFVWDGEWSVDLVHTSCDPNGWSYGLTWWMLALRLRQGSSLSSPGMSLVRRRKWVRHLRASAGGNLPTSIDGFPHSRFSKVNLPTISTMSICAMPETLTSCVESVVDERQVLQNAPLLETKGIERSPSQASQAPKDLPLEARNVLTSHALHAIKLAEDMMQQSDPLHIRRWFHTAAVYFEVISELWCSCTRIGRPATACAKISTPVLSPP